MSDYLVLAARTMVVIVLVMAVVSKTRGRAAFGEFLDWIRQLGVVPDRLTTAVAATMVAAETTAAVLVVIPATQVVGLALAAVVVAFFAGSIAWLTRRGLSLACRCFGAASRPMGVPEIIRNVVIALIAASAAAVELLVPRPGLSVAEVVSAVLLGGAVGLVAVRLDDVVQLVTI